MHGGSLKTLDLMNKKYIVECLERIQDSIESARDSDEQDKLRDNYNSGITQCSEMIEVVKKSTQDISYDSLFNKFDRYVMNSLPWTGTILESIDSERKKIEAKLKSI